MISVSFLSNFFHCLITQLVSEQFLPRKNVNTIKTKECVYGDTKNSRLETRKLEYSILDTREILKNIMQCCQVCILENTRKLETRKYILKSMNFYFNFFFIYFQTYKDI